MPVSDPAARYAALRSVFLSDPEASESRSFGVTALKTDGRIFAMLDADRLVVKLPRNRVDVLVGEGLGTRFDGHRGRPMAEWLSVGFEHAERWQDLAGEARAYVSAGQPGPLASGRAF